MTLEEFRLTLVDRLRQCRDAAGAREIVIDAELVLANVPLTDLTYDRFWETMEEDLDALAGEAKLASDRKAGTILDSVVAAARVRIAHCRNRRKRKKDKAGGDS